MKKIIAPLLCLIIILACVSCGEEEAQTSTTYIEVTGKTYKADMSTVNFAWEEGKTQNEIKQNDFLASIKNWYANSQITFTDENSFTLSGTNNGNYDFIAEGCDRIDNELYKELRMLGNVDVVVYEDRVSFLCDFFVKGWGMYLSIDYVLVK